MLCLPPSQPASVLIPHVGVLNVLQASNLASPSKPKVPSLQFKCHGVPVTRADAYWKAKLSCVTRHQLHRHMAHSAVLGEAASVEVAEVRGCQEGRTSLGPDCQGCWGAFLPLAPGGGAETLCM